MKRMGVAAVALAGVAFHAAPAAAPAKVAWQEVVHAGPSSSARSVAIGGDVVATAGYTSTASGSPRLTVIASRLSSGRPMWTRKLDVTSMAQQVAVGDGVVAVAGYDLTNGQSSGWFVRAYEARSGRELWTDRMVASVHNQGNALAVTVAGGKVYAGGYTGSCEFYGANGCVATLRAYDARGGTKAWERTAGLATTFSSFTALTTSEGRLYAAGGTGNPANLYPSGLLVQSYDAATGAPGWTAPVTTGKAGVGGAFEAATAIAAGPGLVAVGGRTGSISGATNFLVRTFDAKTGAPGWSDVVPGGEKPDTVNGVAFTDRRLVAAGMTSAEGQDEAYTVRAYDPATGKLAWADRIASKGQNRGHQLESATAVAARGGVAYAVGRVGSHCEIEDPGDCDVIVRAYDEREGRPLWSDTYDSSGRDDVGQAVAVSAERLVVAGRATTEYRTGLESKWLVRAYRP